MERFFTITFDYEVSPLRYVRLDAEVKMHETEPYYDIQNISNAYNPKNIPVIPGITITAVRNHDGEITWVQVDTGTETMLSSIVGNTIAKSHEFEIAKQ